MIDCKKKEIIWSYPRLVFQRAKNSRNFQGFLGARKHDHFTFRKERDTLNFFFQRQIVFQATGNHWKSKPSGVISLLKTHRKLNKLLTPKHPFRKS